MPEFNITKTLIKTISNNQPPAAPLKAIFHITTSCNVRCEFCPWHSPLLESRASPFFLPLDQIVPMINDLAAIGTKEICLNAQGEPSSHSQFPEIVNAIKDTGMSLSMHTNFSLSSPKIMAAFARVDTLAINISAVDEESYRKVMGPVSRDSFSNVVKNLAYIRSLVKPPSFKVIYIITKNNFHQIGEAIQFARANGIPLITFKTMFTITETESLVLNDEERMLFLKDISRLMRQSLGVRTNLKEVFNEFFTEKNVAIPFTHCYIGWLTIYIQQDGCVGLCCQNGRLKIGNWKKDNIRNIWKGPKAQQLRLLAKDHLHLKTPFGKACEHCCFAKTNAQVETMLTQFSNQLN